MYLGVKSMTAKVGTKLRWSKDGDNDVYSATKPGPGYIMVVDIPPLGAWTREERESHKAEYEAENRKNKPRK